MHSFTVSLQPRETSRKGVSQEFIISQPQTSKSLKAIDWKMRIGRKNDGPEWQWASIWICGIKSIQEKSVVTGTFKSSRT